jgi:protein-L-isoaspartate(D-aspartate) O-methyltransferase
MADAAIKEIPAPRILDVGAGSGYLTACFGRLVEPARGRVFGIEVIPDLVDFAKKNIQRADPDLIQNNIVSVHGKLLEPSDYYCRRLLC